VQAAAEHKLKEKLEGYSSLSSAQDGDLGVNLRQ
jgi:hypothetical protein